MSTWGGVPSLELERCQAVRKPVESWHVAEEECWAWALASGPGMECGGIIVHGAGQHQ